VRKIAANLILESGKKRETKKLYKGVFAAKRLKRLNQRAHRSHAKHRQETRRGQLVVRRNREKREVKNRGMAFGKKQDKGKNSAFMPAGSGVAGSEPKRNRKLQEGIL